MNKVNIVFGCNGQIGSYLCEYLLSKGESVVGVIRRTSVNNTERLSEVLDNKKFNLKVADVTDPFSLVRLFENIIVDVEVEYIVYNLAAMSFVKASFDQPILSADVTGLGHVNILECLLSFHKLKYNVKLFYMDSSETWGNQISAAGFQNMNIPFVPNSPYGAAKLYAYHMNRIYRESYGVFTSAGIIFNSESPRRGEEFVTRKITKFFAKCIQNKFVVKEKLKLGNIIACRDWSHAKDTVKAIYLIANNMTPKDYIVASGETHTIKDFIDECYRVSETILGQKINIPCEDLYEIDAGFFRPNEVKYLRGDSSEIRKDLGWKPEYNFKSLVKEMVAADYMKIFNTTLVRVSIPGKAILDNRKVLSCEI